MRFNISAINVLPISYKIRQCLLIVLVITLAAGAFPDRSSAGQSGQLPDGPGKEELRKLCSQCHELEKSFSIKQDRAGWTRTMQKMAAFGMKSTEAEYNAVLEYLVINYAAEEVQKINVNKAKAIELESGLSLKRSQAAAIVEYRTKYGNFKSIEDLKKVPGIDVEKIEAKKDRLIFEE